LWQGVTLEPPDGIFALKDRCENDAFPQKIDLSVGAYRDEDAKPWTLPAVGKACALITRIHSSFLTPRTRVDHAISIGRHSIGE
jgi:aspartate/tyrosine/aromatic aminotransferase